MRFGSFRPSRSLSAKLLCTYVAALCLTTLPTMIWLHLPHDLGQLGLQRIESWIKLDDAGVPQAVEVPPDIARCFVDFQADVKYRVLDRSGVVLFSSGRDKTALTPVGHPFDPALRSFILRAGGEMLQVSTVRRGTGAGAYYIQVALSTRFDQVVRSVTTQVVSEHTWHLMRRSLLLVSIAVYFTLWKVLQPLREVSVAAGQINERTLSKRLDTCSVPREFLPVIKAFNLTLSRLEKGCAIQRALLADTAHELKTPLALIRAQIEADGADREALLQDIDRMARQVNQLLHLAQASEAQNYVFERVHPASAVEDVVDYLRSLAERRQVYVHIRRSAAAPAIEADRGALFMLLKNLVENAIQHSPVGGAVTLQVDSDHLSVSDDGPGIRPEELPQLFRRFWTGSMRRHEGTGLGLAICAEIAAAHQWAITARSAGCGAEFVVSFIKPASAANVV